LSQPTKAEVTKIAEAVNTLTTLVAETRKDIEYTQADSTDLKRGLEKLSDQFHELRSQVAALQAGFDEFKKRWDDSDRRRWTVYGVMIAAALTFVANLVLLFLKR
jgi:predicted  nucleic acid-binding Zn-ribbon protein